jgi:hypothetical protein
MRFVYAPVNHPLPNHNYLNLQIHLLQWAGFMMTQMRLKPTKRYFFITNYTLFPTDNTVKGDECSSQGSVVPRAHRFRGFFRGELKLTPPLQFDH